MIKLIHGDCLEEMKNIPDCSVDLTITSPPYDKLREYNGNNILWCENVWKSILIDLHRVTKTGGVVVWVVADSIVKGAKSLTSFKQAIYAQSVGFIVFDVIVWDKKTSGSIGASNRYENIFEYIFVFSKSKPKTINLIKDKKNKRSGELQSGSIRKKDGTCVKTSNYGKKKIAEFGRRGNIWSINAVKSKRDRLHPAPFPLTLVEDCMATWSKKEDCVLDPFMGSGTTGVAAKNLNRNFIGIELDENYFNIAKNRIEGC